jgi:glycosyltransferase involved in cell wall biosynthesis
VNGDRLRIALFTDTFRPTLNGVARALGLLVDHGDREGHEIALITPDIEGSDRPEGALHIRLPGVALPFYPEVPVARPWLGRTNRHRLSAFAPDLVHAATEGSVGLLGRRWATSRGLPLVSSYCTNFAEYAAGYGMGLLEGRVWALLRWFHAAARVTFCPSEATRRDLRNRGFHRRMRIWGRGVDARLFNPAKRSAALRASMAPDADVVLMYVGRIAPEKRVDLLLEALPEIRERARRRVALVFVGGGPALEGLEALAPDGIHFAGYRTGEDLAAHYASADVFVFPSDTETFGQVVTEAMASGLPVVAPARGGVMDTVVPGRTGFLFEPGNVRDLARHVLRLVEDDELRRRMAIDARLAAETRSWDEVHSRLFRDYRETLSPGDTSVITRTRDGTLA